MKVLNVQGRKKTGKTTTVTNIIAELTRRGYSVGSVKSIHIDGFSMDSENADTGKHRKAGADPVTARCHGETNIMFGGKMNLREILKYYDNDWVVIESHVDLNCPNIITGKTAEYSGAGKDESLAEQINELTIACSGVISNDISEFRGLPVINPVAEIERLVDVIEKAEESFKLEGISEINSAIDWNRMWRESEVAEHAERLDFWDNFAPTFHKKTEEPDVYVEKFYEYMDAKPAETLFDMGCGPGTLAVAFALKGHEVWAADFSSRMLEQLRINAEAAGVSDRIHAIRLNWNEDWTERELPVCDIAFSSRSLICEDLTSALQKLESVARRKVCMGVWDTPATGYDRNVAAAIGYERPGTGAHYMVMGELMDRDVYPELRYIFSPAKMGKYESREAAIKSLRKSFTHITEEQDELLLKHVNEHLVLYKEPVSYHGKHLDEYWQFDHKKTGSMAFISWEIKNKQAEE